MSTKKLFTDRRWTDPPDVIVTGHQEVPLESKLRALDFWLANCQAKCNTFEK